MMVYVGTDHDGKGWGPVYGTDGETVRLSWHPPGCTCRAGRPGASCFAGRVTAKTAKQVKRELRQQKIRYRSSA